MRAGSSRLARVAAWTGAAAALDRLGLRDEAADLARWIRSRAERERASAIQHDYRQCRDVWRRIAEGAPHGDPNTPVLLVGSLPTVWGLKMEGVLSLALRRAGFDPIAIQISHTSWIRRYHELFGIRRGESFDRFDGGSVPADSRIPEFARSRPGVRDLLAFAYRGVDIGRVALSNVLNRRKFVKFDLKDPETLVEICGELAGAERHVDAAERLIASTRPALAILLEKGVSPMAEIFGVCLTHGVPVVQYTGSQDTNAFVLRRFTAGNRHQHPFSLDGTTWQRVKAMAWSAQHETELMEDFAVGYREGTWFNRKYLHDGKQIKSPETVRRELELDSSKKTAVVFSHVLWDATFFYGEGLFDDYETWLLETVRAACANPHVNWVIKLHPDLVWKLRYEGYTGELRDVVSMRSAVGQLPPHVRIVLPETDISTWSFFPVTDYCITVRGTIGIEMACHGVPVVTAGTGRYSGLGFTVDSASAAEYLERLARIQALPPMSDPERELARRFAYTLFKRRPWSLRSFETVKMPRARAGHPLDHNLVPRIASYAEFAAADDMRQFTEWIRSGDVDYLAPDEPVADAPLAVAGSIGTIR